MEPDPKERGWLHIEGVRRVRFYDCTFASNDRPAVSLRHADDVVAHGSTFIADVGIDGDDVHGLEVTDSVHLEPSKLTRFGPFGMPRAQTRVAALSWCWQPGAELWPGAQTVPSVLPIELGAPSNGNG